MSLRWLEDSGTFELVEFFELLELFASAWGRHLEAVCWLSPLEVQERLMLVAFGRKWYYNLKNILMLASYSFKMHVYHKSSPCKIRIHTGCPKKISFWTPVFINCPIPGLSKCSSWWLGCDLREGGKVLEGNRWLGKPRYILLGWLGKMRWALSVELGGS